MASKSYDGGGLRVTPHTLRGLNPGGPGFKPGPGIKLPVIQLPRISIPNISLPFGQNYGRTGIQGAMQTGTDPNNRLKQILRGR